MLQGTEVPVPIDLEVERPVDLEVDPQETSAWRAPPRATSTIAQG